ncbi:hypothetical protein [Halobaculum sp. EA56]|uniref:hypothetical protein n=1 Tax=Halobaculum sp. EA56 TaxID=3421648 RepID=UPI003EB7F2EB
MTDVAESGTLHQPDGWADSGPREAQAHPGIHGTYYRYGNLEWWHPENLYDSDYQRPICPVNECATGEPHECRTIAERIEVENGSGAWLCKLHGHFRVFEYPRDDGTETEQAQLVADGGKEQSRIRCLGCGTVSDSVREHRRHMARAGHVDQGETYIR